MEEINEKANYCLTCKTKPCTKGCPLENDIAGFIEQIKKENYRQAYEILNNTTVLQSICGRICPHERQCQGNCIRRNKIRICKNRGFRSIYWRYSNKRKL